MSAFPETILPFRTYVSPTVSVTPHIESVDGVRKRFCISAMSAFGFDCGRKKQRRKVKHRLHFANTTNVCLRAVRFRRHNNTHLEHPVYLDLVSDLIVVDGENLFHPHHDDCDRRTSLTVVKLLQRSKSDSHCYLAHNSRMIL